MNEPTEEEILAFDRLRTKAATLHELAWCTKASWFRFTASLRGRECCRCPEYVLQGGICDPL